jgi:hypothetical protein
VRRPKIIGWLLVLAGTVLWLYGYLRPGTKSFVDWAASTPPWIADYLPSREAELGLILMCIGMIPLYWPSPNEGS